MDIFENARRKYKPKFIKYLLVAEAPPKKDSNRFFYFENVSDKDSLFLEIIKCLYFSNVDNYDIKAIRGNKKEYLEKLREDGFYLIDSLDDPFEEKYSSKRKEQLLRNGQVGLFEKIEVLCTKETNVILIAATVFNANFNFLKAKGVNVINHYFLDFPGSGGQKNFRTKFLYLLKTMS